MHGMGVTLDRAVTTAEGGEAPSSRPGRRWWTLLFLGHCALVAPIAISATYFPERWIGPNDFTGHITKATPMAFPEWWQVWRPVIPHPMYHVSVRLVGHLTPGQDLILPGAIAAIAFAGLGGVAWAWGLRQPDADGRRMPTRTAATASFVLLAMEAPQVLSGWSTMWGPHYFIPLFAYHSVTGLVARAFLVLVLVAFQRVLVTPDDGSRAVRRSHHLLFAAAILADLSKPGLTLCLLAVAPFVAVVQSRRDGRSLWAVARPLAQWYVAPSAVLVVLQSLIMRYQLKDEYQLTTPIEPFRMLALFGGANPWFWLVFSLPIVLLVAYGRQLARDPFVELALWCTGAGLVVFSLVSSSNPTHTGPEAMWLIIQSLCLFLLFAARRVWFLHHDGVRPARALGAAVVVLSAVYVAAFVDFTTCQTGIGCLKSSPPTMATFD